MEVDSRELLCEDGKRQRVESSEISIKYGMHKHNPKDQSVVL